MSTINITVPDGTDEGTRDLVQRAVEGAIAACGEDWGHVVQRVANAVADAVHAAHLEGATATAADVRDSHRAAELALEVIRQALPDVFATVEKSVRKATIVRAPDGQIQSVITRTIDVAAA